MMVDGKYADETKTSSAWDESWVAGNYYTSGAHGSTANADANNARGAVTVKNGGRGICPMGWHIPTVREWAAMLDKVEGSGTGNIYSAHIGSGWIGTDAGKKLKSAGTFTTNASDPSDGTWLESANRGIDAHGFGALPAGRRGWDGSMVGYRGIRTHFFSSCVASPNFDFVVGLIYNDARTAISEDDRTRALSVRCVMDL
jgi:uncharacterized protein (TIGR02145 family)